MRPGRASRYLAALAAGVLAAAALVACGGGPGSQQLAVGTGVFPSVPETTVEGVRGSDRAAFLELAGAIGAIRAQGSIVGSLSGSRRAFSIQQLDSSALRLKLVRPGDKRLAAVRQDLLESVLVAAAELRQGKAARAARDLRAVTRNRAALRRFARGKPSLRRLVGK